MIQCVMSTTTHTGTQPAQNANTTTSYTTPKDKKPTAHIAD